MRWPLYHGVSMPTNRGRYKGVPAVVARERCKTGDLRPRELRGPRVLIDGT